MTHMCARVLVTALLVAATSADAAVLCAKRLQRAGGATVKLRDACRASEVQLTAADVGFCCTATTQTTTTSVTTTTVICPTTTTLGVPNCGPGGCGFPCLDGRMCTDPGDGQCVCTGTAQCGGTLSVCGGECPAGQVCAQLPVPPGCSSIGCTCQ